MHTLAEEKFWEEMKVRYGENQNMVSASGLACRAWCEIWQEGSCCYGENQTWRAGIWFNLWHRRFHGRLQCGSFTASTWEACLPP